MYKPVVLVILDGWGISNSVQGNVLRTTTLPTIEKLNKFYPLTALQASGISVGLPWGEVGNSEVGHITLGAGKIIYQNLPRITLSIQDLTFFQNPAFLTAVTKAKERGGALHIMGLIGDGSTHSYLDHAFALIELAKMQNMDKLFFHAFTDGRDSPPTSGANTVRRLQERLRQQGVGKIASLCGRNWAMDRNNNWDRIEKAYRMLTEGVGIAIEDPAQYLEELYKKPTADGQAVSDEYVEPAVVHENGKPVATIQDNDAVIFFNFREDRAREITKAFVLPSFDKFPRPKRLQIEFVAMTEYEKDLPVAIAFPRETASGGLGGTLSQHNLKQLRIAETEKYAHVTYFFNGGKEEPWLGEDRVLVPSPSVSRFDQSPEMSAPKITEKVIELINLGKYDFILMNYANADMVGHTGNQEACVQAIQSIDKSLSLLIPAVLQAGGCILITADHGNIEEIKDTHTGQTNTEHSANPVPLWFIAPDNHLEKTTEEIVRQESEVGGLLSDVAPTILELIGIPKPKEMNGESLLPMLK